MRIHWPFQSGYFDSSCALAAVIATPKAAATATDPIALRRRIENPPRLPPDQSILARSTTGRPSRKLIWFTFQAPPGAPLRNGQTIILSSSPALMVLLDHPSRTRALGLAPSRFQVVDSPSLALTWSRMNVCGLVNLNSTTTPSSSAGLS